MIILSEIRSIYRKLLRIFSHRKRKQRKYIVVEKYLNLTKKNRPYYTTNYTTVSTWRGEIKKLVLPQV
jgi:hypothetical protein